MDFAVPVDCWMKIKENEKRDMKATVMPIIISALGTVTKSLIKGLEVLEIVGRAETIQSTPLLRSARILRRVLETWGDVLW